MSKETPSTKKKHSPSHRKLQGAHFGAMTSGPRSANRALDLWELWDLTPSHNQAVLMGPAGCSPGGFLVLGAATETFRGKRENSSSHSTSKGWPPFQKGGSPCDVPFKPRRQGDFLKACSPPNVAAWLEIQVLPPLAPELRLLFIRAHHAGLT